MRKHCAAKLIVHFSFRLKLRDRVDFTLNYAQTKKTNIESNDQDETRDEKEKITPIIIVQYLHTHKHIQISRCCNRKALGSV